jgi:hypothetical protein
VGAALFVPGWWWTLDREIGYTMVPSRVWDALTCAPLTGMQMRIAVLALYRAYYDHESSPQELTRIAMITVDDATKSTGLPRRNVRESLAALHRAGMLIRAPDGNGSSVYGFNSDISRWIFFGRHSPTMTAAESGNTFSAKVLRRDGQCLRCGSTEELHAHHILPKSQYPELKRNPSNGITLCANCHRKLKCRELEHVEELRSLLGIVTADS